MEASLSVIENTPKLKVVALKEKVVLTEKSSMKVCPVKPTLMPSRMPPLTANLHRSKSVFLVKNHTEKVNKVKGLHKRSSSLNDLRPQKKQTYAMTPMCLK